MRSNFSNSPSDTCINFPSLDHTSFVYTDRSIKSDLGSNSGVIFSQYEKFQRTDKIIWSHPDLVNILITLKTLDKKLWPYAGKTAKNQKSFCPRLNFEETYVLVYWDYILLFLRQKGGCFFLSKFNNEWFTFILSDESENHSSFHDILVKGFKDLRLCLTVDLDFTLVHYHKH